MKNKVKKRFYFFFAGLTFTGFGLGLAWYLLDSVKNQSQPQEIRTEEKEDRVQVIEDKERSAEEKRALPEISSEELAFRERALKVLKEFPKKEILKDKKRDLHKPPRELVEASSELGVIEDLLDQNPELSKEGMRFYRRCALQEELLTSLRALCLHNLKSRSKKNGFFNKIRWGDFPDYLHRIADKL